MFRILRKRRQLRPVVDRTNSIHDKDILAFVTVRNEMERLPHFINYYRALGVDHFLFIDNDSDDGTQDYLQNQPDVSLWSTGHPYRLARFGMDWLGWLLFKYGHNHWCLTVDADELLTYPFDDTRKLQDLTKTLDRAGKRSFGAIMLDMYPKGPIGDQTYEPGSDPIKTLPYFDADNYHTKWHHYYDNLWIRGGIRARHFFADQPARAPTLNKVPLVRWDRRFVYASSMHQMLPRHLNDVFGDQAQPTGALLHTKFLPSIIAKSKEEQIRRQHFENSELYEMYYSTLINNPDLWHEGSCCYAGWQQLASLGLIQKGS